MGEVKKFSFDFQSALVVGEEITSVVFNLYLREGTDENINSHILVEPTINSAIVSQVIDWSGCIYGNVYTIDAVVTTSAGNTYQADALVEIAPVYFPPIEQAFSGERIKYRFSFAGALSGCITSVTVTSSLFTQIEVESGVSCATAVEGEIDWSNVNPDEETKIIVECDDGTTTIITIVIIVVTVTEEPSPDICEGTYDLAPWDGNAEFVWKCIGFYQVRAAEYQSFQPPWLDVGNAWFKTVDNLSGSPSEDAMLNAIELCGCEHQLYYPEARLEYANNSVQVFYGAYGSDGYMPDPIAPIVYSSADIYDLLDLGYSDGYDTDYYSFSAIPEECLNRDLDVFLISVGLLTYSDPPTGYPSSYQSKDISSANSYFERWYRNAPEKGGIAIFQKIR